jgi:hypothetical protein
LESLFGCPGFLHASIEVLIEYQVCDHPDIHAARRLFVELYEAVPELYPHYQVGPAVYVLALAAHKQCRIRIWHVGL